MGKRTFSFQVYYEVTMPGKRKRESITASPKIKSENDAEAGGSTPSPAKKRKSINRLIKKSQMFAKQLTQKTDFTINCDGHDIDVHSQLLSARSPVFDTMFGGKFRESIENAMEIEDSEPRDLIEFLKYFYPRLQEKLRLRRGNVAQILYLAEKYDVPELRDRCEETLEKLSNKEQSVSRIMPWLKISFDYNMEDLQRTIVERISKRFPNFDRTPTFKALPSELKLELMKKSKLVISERLEKLCHIAFDENKLRRMYLLIIVNEEIKCGYRSDVSRRSASGTAFKTRVINMQALFTQWKDGDPSSPEIEPDDAEPGIDSDNAETDGDSGDELP